VGFYNPAGFFKRFATAPYALAALAVAAAIGLRLAFDPVLASYSPYLPFVAAVLLVARLGGRGPALLATALSSLSVWYFFLEPRFSFAISQPTAAVGLGLFSVIAIALSLLEAPGGLLSGRDAADRLKRSYADEIGAPLLRRIAMMAGGALALGILASLLWSGFQRSMDAKRLVDHTYQVLNAAAALRSSLETAETSQRGYLLTANDRYLDAYESAVVSERRARASLRALTVDSRVQQARLDEFDRLVGTRLALLASAIEVRRRQGAEAAANQVRSSGGKELMDQLRAMVDAVDDEERRLLEIRTMAARAADLRTRWILGLGTGSLVLLLILAGGSMERHIHERERAENVLARQARLIDLSHDAIITADGHRVITGWNSGAQEMYGWTEKEATGQVMHELLHTGHSIPVSEMDRILSQEGRWHGELAHTRSNGRQIVVESRQVLQRDNAGRPAGYLEINRDITERKRAEEALRQSRARLEAALASMTDAVFIADAEGRFIHFNDAFARFHRFPGKEQCSTTFAEYPAILDLCYADGTPVPPEMWNVPRALRGETGNNVEFALRRRDTGESWVGSYCFGPVRDQGGRIVGAVVVARDITDRKRAEEEIRQLNTELEQRVRERTAELETANRELEAFAYSVSHDLRAPLRGIDGWSLALMEDYCGECEKLDGKGRSYLERVRSETQRMGHLIDDLLQLSRITRAEMHRHAVDLSAIAESVAARLRDIHPQRCLEFAIRPGLTAFGDARLLEIALTNLLDNAVKFTGPRAHARIEFDTVACEGRTAFVVRDNGVGFDMAYAGTLFGAFQRLHSDSEFSGTGIGLATVQRVVHRHGGRIWAEAAPDRGAAFYFTLGTET
jgi:PAS domain S-box-containing protein